MANVSSGETNGQNLVFTPSSLPIISQLSIDSLMLHWSDSVFDKGPTSHIRSLTRALCGESGLGELLRRSVTDWLNGGVETAWLMFLDRLFESIYGLPRIYAETTPWDTRDALVTADEAAEVLIREGWYKSRFVELMQGLCAGGTVEGFHHIIRAVTYDDADIYETWRYVKKDFPVGRMDYTLYNEVVIVPYNKETTEQQRDLLLRILDRIKPSDVIVTVDMNGLEATIPYDIRSATASSSYFEIVRTITNSIDNAVLPSSIDLFGSKVPHGYDSIRNLKRGESAEIPEAIQNRTQEYSEYYVYDKSSIAQIQNVFYQSVSGTGDQMRVIDEQPYSESTATVKWSSWRAFDRADSPDNYPGGKYGRTPMVTPSEESPAVNKDGTPYIWEWPSQNAYETARSREIIADGGEVSGHNYRLRLSTAKQTTTFLPELSLVSVNDSVSELTMLPEQNDITSTQMRENPLPRN